MLKAHARASPTAPSPASAGAFPADRAGRPGYSSTIP
jgi:hypothetical protein